MLLFKKDGSKLITYPSGDSNSQIDYFIVRKRGRKLVQDVKVIPSVECVQQHKLLVCDIKSGNCKPGGVYVPGREAWKPSNQEVKEGFKTLVVESEPTGGSGVL